MAAARDQAARILRTEPNAAESDSARDNAAALAAQPSDETVARHPAEVPERPAIARPAAPQAPAVSVAPKPGKRKFLSLIHI